MSDSPPNPPAPPEPPKPKTPIEVLGSLRERAMKLHGELHPLTKDAPVPGASQKTARRTQAALGLFVELCDFIETNVLKGKK